MPEIVGRKIPGAGQADLRRKKKRATVRRFGRSQDLVELPNSRTAEQFFVT